jgi:hypothetical protein
MNDRKHCSDCALDYTDETAHQLVHEAVASVPSTGAASEETSQPQQA